MCMAGPGNPVLGPVLQKNISGFDLGFLKISPALDPVLTNLHLNWCITTGQSPVLVTFNFLTIKCVWQFGLHTYIHSRELGSRSSP
jgi:hypothetical protein